MKLTIERADLLRALGAATAVVERRATIPVLMNVLIEAAGDEVRIVASDLEIQIGITVPAQVAEAGAVTVAAQLIHSIVRETDEGAQIELELGGTEQGERLKLSSGRGRYRLPTIAAADFPLVKAVAGAGFDIAAAHLATMLKSIAFAMSIEETRYYLMGVHIDVRDATLAMAATNGHVLAAVTAPAPKGAELLERGIILHRKLIGELIKLIDGVEGDLSLATDYERVTIRLGSTEIVSKLVDGDYPDWRRHIPAANPDTLKVRTAALAGAVRRAGTINNEKTRSVRVDFKSDLVLVSVRSDLNGTAEEEVPCGYDAREFAIGLNSRYVLDALDAIGAEDIEVAVDAEHSGPSIPATLFTSPSRPDGQWVIMPMRV